MIVVAAALLFLLALQIASDRTAPVSSIGTVEGLVLPMTIAEIDRDWVQQAIHLLQGDGRRSADTHLVKPAFRGLRGISVYLKDESTHPTGSLKHWLARSLFLYGICNGRIGPGTTLVEASSGSTAVSRGIFCRAVGLALHRAVMPRSTSQTKIEAISRPQPFGVSRRLPAIGRRQEAFRCR